MDGHDVPRGLGSGKAEATRLLRQVDGLIRETHAGTSRLIRGWDTAAADPKTRAALENLARYIALRQQDLGPLQLRLAALGLSSLGRCEAHVGATLQAVRCALAHIAGIASDPYPPRSAWIAGRDLLAARKRLLFAAEGSAPGIMVTMPTEAAGKRDLVADLLNEGMTVARINCAHDGPDVWAAMIEHVRSLAAEQGVTCRILMDLGGPKSRIETVAPAKPDPLHRGDRILLARAPGPSPKGAPARITISFPEVVDRLVPGQPVWINDGKIRCIVREPHPDGWVLDVVGARAKGEKLKPEKGVNLPGVDLRLPPLSEEDLAALDFVARHADLVGFSFVQRASDVDILDRELRARLGSRALPSMVLKIETAEAVRNLPHLIARASAMRPAAVMIARGDLAVDIGFDRMAEIQEEILWVCEAASTPVVWATQVLDDLVRDGLPSRAEATDAAMAQRAECVMLNKGPYLKEGIQFLARVMERMERHQSKKAARFGVLHSWPLGRSKADVPG